MSTLTNDVMDNKASQRSKAINFLHVWPQMWCRKISGVNLCNILILNSGTHTDWLIFVHCMLGNSDVCVCVFAYGKKTSTRGLLLRGAKE